MSPHLPLTIVLVGGPYTGKSHYSYQLFGRLRDGKSALRLNRPPKNLELFENGLRCLYGGLSAEHTAADFYGDCELELVTNEGVTVSLVWPDYGGEQLNQMLERRALEDEWPERLRSADGWFFFLRLDQLTECKNTIKDPLSMELKRREASEDEQVTWSDQAKVIELLQFMLYAAQVDLSRPVKSPKLGVLLSCWDELHSQSDSPNSELAARAPLVNQFIHANWAPNSLFILGLSSLGKELSKETPDEEYRQRGPESFGFVLNDGQGKSDDLTTPILRMMGLCNESPN